MSALFHLTLYAGQQLVLDTLHRYIQRPCRDADPATAQRQRRAGLRSLLMLLLKTAATGVAATVLDAAIEYRRRQIAAAAGSSSSADEPPTGMLSRVGVSAWKARLLICIDELERRAQLYGIESRRRNGAEGKPGEGDEEALAAGFKALSLSRSPSMGLGGEEGEERQRALARTVEQLQSLVKAEDEEGEGAGEEGLEREVDSLLHSLLEGWREGSEEGLVAAAASAAAAAGSPRAVAAGAAGEAGAAPAAAAEACHICMDRPVRVQVDGCRHAVCFQCARRLCATQDHQLPQCPFCRQTINGFVAWQEA